jgi:biopolymer transport protein ExbB
MDAELASTFQIGPIAFWSILGGSALVLGLALEQLYHTWGLGVGARELGSELSKVLYQSNFAAARSLCERSSHPVANVFIAALNKVQHPGESLEKAAERERQRLSMLLKRRLWAIGTVGATAPFVGLFGTVVGIIRAFKDIAAAGAGGFSVVAEGVSEALVATAGGILVAVLAVVLYNWLQARVNRATVELRLVIDEFLEQLTAAVERGGPPPAPTSGEHRISSPPVPVGATAAAEG